MYTSSSKAKLLVGDRLSVGISISRFQWKRRRKSFHYM